jgi:hypothetical protein
MPSDGYTSHDPLEREALGYSRNEAPPKATTFATRGRWKSILNKIQWSQLNAYKAWDQQVCSVAAIRPTALYFVKLDANLESSIFFNTPFYVKNDISYIMTLYMFLKGMFLRNA